MMTYFIVYADLSVYDSSTGDPLPMRGVQVIVQPHRDVGWHTQSGYDFYLRRDGRWVGVDRAGLFEDLEENGLVKFNVGFHHQVLIDDEWTMVDEFGLYKWIEDTGYALFGRTLTTKVFNDAMKVALGIRAVEREKSGWLANEPRIDH
jgi:hypothetical protein